MIHQLQYHLPVAFHFHYLISPSKSIHPPFFLWRAELQQSTVLRSPGVPSSHSTASSSLQCMSMVNIFLKIHAALVSFIGFLALLSEVKHLFFKGQYCSGRSGHITVAMHRTGILCVFSHRRLGSVYTAARFAENNQKFLISFVSTWHVSFF